MSEQELPAEDVATALAWIDGELERDAALAFELRLAADRELARRIEALVGVDDLLRAEARAIARTRRRRSRLRLVWTVAAVAAAALFLFVLLPRLRGPRGPALDVALAPSFALAEDWVGSIPDLGGASAPGIAVSRGENPRQLGAKEFLDKSAAAEDALAAGALAAQQRALDAGWFVVPIELDQPCVVLVLGFSASTGAARLFPSSEPYEVQAHVPAGRSLLPSPRAVEGKTPQTLEYRPGFLVPLGAGELTLLVAARPDPEDGALQPLPIEDLDVWLKESTPINVVAARLESRGFRVERLVVREPK